MAGQIHRKAAPRDDELDDAPEPANLRFLRRMVTLLMVTMIVGIAVVAGALVIGIAGGENGPAMTEIRVEAGYEVVSVKHGAADRLVVVLRETGTGGQVIRVYRTDGPAEDYRVVTE